MDLDNSARPGGVLRIERNEISRCRGIKTRETKMKMVFRIHRIPLTVRGGKVGVPSKAFIAKPQA